MFDANLSVRSTVRRLCEVAFSLNLAFATTSCFLHYGPRQLVEPLERMEIHINRVWLGHVRQDFFTGYYELYIPGTALALCMWALLLLSRRRSWPGWFLRWAGGIAALSAAPLVWLDHGHGQGWRLWTWSEVVLLVEVVLVERWLIIQLRQRSPVPMRVSIPLLSLHCAIWFWQFGTEIFYAYDGPIPPIVALAACLTWALYVASPMGRDFKGKGKGELETGAKRGKPGETGGHS